MKTTSTCIVAAIAALTTVAAATAAPLGMAFTYQGHLHQDGAPADGVYDFRFTLFDAPFFGNEVEDILVDDVVVEGGLFTVEIEFTNAEAFNLDERWMATAVRADGFVPYTTLTPRQNVTAAPYALRVSRVESGELADDIDLGDPTNAGSLQIFSGNSADPTLSASGSDGQLIVGEESGVSDAQLIVNATGSHAMRVRTDGTTRFFIGSDGQVGIRDATPDAALDVHAATANEDALAVYQFGTVNSSLLVDANGNVLIGEESGNTDAQLVVNAASGPAMRVRTDGSTRFYIGADGQVGIRDATPDAALDVHAATSNEDALAVYQFGTANSSLLVDSDGNVLIGEESGNTDAQLVVNAATGPAMRVRTDGTTRFYIGSDGQVGIRDSSPNAALDVHAATSNEDALAVYPFGTVNSSLMVESDGDVGIGANEPLAPLHVADTDIAVSSGALSNDVMIVEDSDAVVGLYSGGGGNWGSGVVLGQVDGNGTLQNKWSMVRRTSAAGGSLRWTYGPNSSYATNTSLMTLSTSGTLSVPVLSITGADLAERFPSSEAVEPGTVMALDPQRPGELCVARGAYNHRVAGVVSGANDLPAGAILGNLPGNEQAPAIALSGRVWVQCDTRTAAIEIGDLLTTSDTAGHAMKVQDFDQAHGAIIGKAMTALPAEQSGLVLVLVGLQ